MPYLMFASAIPDHPVQSRLCRLFPNRQDRERPSCWHHDCTKHSCCFGALVKYQVRVVAHMHDCDVVIMMVIQRNEDVHIRWLSSLHHLGVR